MEAYRRASQQDPKAAEPLAALSEAAFAAGNFPLAAETLLEAFGRDPAWFDGRFSSRLPIPGRGLEEERRKPCAPARPRPTFRSGSSSP